MGESAAFAVIIGARGMLPRWQSAVRWPAVWGHLARLTTALRRDPRRLVPRDIVG